MSKKVNLLGKPNKKQQAFFASRCKFTAYGGARGGGKSWALRRKLILMAFRYPGITALIIRRSYGELRCNHMLPLLAELGDAVHYSDAAKCFTFPNGSRIFLGFCAAERDVLRYQGQEYDVIAIDEATQLTEYQFMTLKACLRGTSGYPKRMYLTCNPGGVGHAWVKRLFVDRIYRPGEREEDYCFVQALVYDNEALMAVNPDYVSQLDSLPEKLRSAWLEGRWDLFEGQFFPEFTAERHVEEVVLPAGARRFCAMDYGFDMTAVVFCAVDGEGRLTVYREFCRSGLTISEAAEAVASLCAGEEIEYIAASPDLWNRRQDTGYSGFEIMSRNRELPPLIRADDRRVIGWRCLREYLRGERKLIIDVSCTELIRCLGALLFDKRRCEDAASEPHSITHMPEALRYAVMSRTDAGVEEDDTWDSGAWGGVSLADY